MIPATLASALSDRYRIERELGQGGMATVYLAEDLKHHRKVAIKVLRPELAAVIGPERFVREIRTIANLQHPHILGLIDSGEVSGTAYYVMPFVDGESLRDRLTREKQLPVADAIRLATEVAGALDYAHRHGVIHRDIKPENILLHDGRALVADFGIALAVSSAGGSTRMTETGMSLGTPHYMSPEQAMGEREITARSDVYALGCISYEMLVGEPPFTGPTAQAIIAKVMTTEPASLTSQRKTVPPAVEDAVLTALQKLPADRFATAAEFAKALEGRSDGQTVRRTGVQPRTAEPPDRRTALQVALALTTIALIAVSAWALLRGKASSGPTVYDAVLPERAPISFGLTSSNVAHGESFRNITVAPAGDRVVYAAAPGDTTTLWIRNLLDEEARPLAGTVGATAPRFSPDGAHVAYLLGDDVMLVSLTGGEPRVLLSGSVSTDAVNWLSPTQLIVGTEDGFRGNWVDIQGGAPRTRRMARCPFARLIPQSNRLICSYNRSATVLDPENDTRWPMRMTKPDGSPGDPVAGTGFIPIGGKYIIYFATDGMLVGARFDTRTYLVSRPVRLLSGIRRETLGEGQFDIAGNGTLVYARGVDATQGRVVKLRAGGVPEPLPVPAADFQRLGLSRDGRWLAAAVTGMQHSELRIYDLINRQESIWAEGDMVRHPLWSRDGRSLMYGIVEGGRWRLLRGEPGSGAEPVTFFDTTYSGQPGLDPVDWHDEHAAIAQDWSNFSTLRFDPTAAKPVFETLATGATFGSVSGNGKLLSYQTQQNNRIMVMGLGPGMRRWQVASVGAEPIWLTATELLFRDGFSWYKVTVNPETGEPGGPPVFWARDPRFSDTSGWSNRPTTDGAIIYVQAPDEHGSAYLRVIPNWVAHMKAAVDSAGK